MGPVARFAGDAQTLSQALGAGDNAGARRATASLDADAAAVDAALKAHGDSNQARNKIRPMDALKHQALRDRKERSALRPHPPLRRRLHRRPHQASVQARPLQEPPSMPPPRR